MKRRLLFAAALFLHGCDSGSGEGPKRDLEAEALWAELMAEAYDLTWAAAPGYDQPLPAQGPHGEEVVILVNSVVEHAFHEGATLTSWPIGSTVVKHAFAGGELSRIPVMQKRASGWYFAEFDAEGAPVDAGQPARCLGCHTAANDHVISFELPVNPCDVDGASCVGEGGAPGTCAGGTCVVACTAANGATACDDGNPCTTDSCDAPAGACIHAALDDVEAGAALQTANDCKKMVCENGVLIAVADGADLPVDANECTEDVCNGMAPAHPPVAARTACGQGGLCNGDAATPACVECLAPSDCTELPADDECQTRTCTLGVCGQSFAAADTPLGSQVAGDCLTAVCNGAGGVGALNDGADLPVDGDECTDDVCSMGVASNPRIDGRALAVQTAGDCKRVVCDAAGGTRPADDDTDLPDDNNECTADTCDAGTPDHAPLEGNSCGMSGALVCDATGACVNCLTASDCGVDTFCEQWSCGNDGVCVPARQPAGTVVGAFGASPDPQVAQDCMEWQCNASGAAVNVVKQTDLPVDGQQCTSDECSVTGVPSNPPRPVNTICTQDGGSFCDTNGACVECNNAAQCPGGAECTEPTCVSNTCDLGPAPAGTPLATQSPGDCKRMECDGTLAGTREVDDDGDAPADPTDGDCRSVACSSGTSGPVNDDSDLPADSDPTDCSMPVCSMGVPGEDPVGPGQPCATGTCDGGGVCISGAVSAMNQTLDTVSTRVTVATYSLGLMGGGWLVIRSGSASGPVLGAKSVVSGSGSNVGITLTSPLADGSSLVAVLYHEDSGTAAFEDTETVVDEATFSVTVPAGTPAIVFTMSGNGADYFVDSVVPSDLGMVLPALTPSSGGDVTLPFKSGWRYELTVPSFHPIRIRQGTTVLLSQNSVGSLEGDAQIAWEELASGVRFTVASGLTSADDYICGIHVGMEGVVSIVP